MFHLFKSKVQTEMKTPNQMREEMGLEPIKNPEVEDLSNTKVTEFERLAKELLEFEFVTSSPNDGSLISAIRSEDVLNTIAEFYGVDIEKSSYSDFKK